MNSTEIVIVVAASVLCLAVLYILGKSLSKILSDKHNANKTLVYVNTLVITYCGVGTDLMNKKSLSYTDNTYEKALITRQKLLDIAQKAYQRLDSISDKELLNFENMLVIHKNQFIAIEVGLHTEYK